MSWDNIIWFLIGVGALATFGYIVLNMVAVA